MLLKQSSNIIEKVSPNIFKYGHLSPSRNRALTFSAPTSQNGGRTHSIHRQFTNELFEHV